MIINDIAQLIKIIEKRFPIKNAEDWDFSGFSIKAKNLDSKTEKLKIMIALDATEKAIDYAIKHNYDILITHHPFIFAPSSEEYLLEYPSLLALVRKAQKAQLSLYAIHTNFDNDPNGTAYQIFKRLDLRKSVIREHISSSVLIELDEAQKVRTIAKKIKKSFSFYFFATTAAKNKNISTIFLSPGAGDINEVINYNETISVDLYITSDLKWNEKLLLMDKKIDYLEVPHKIEEVFIDSLYKYLIEDCKVENKIFKFNTRTKAWFI